MEPVGIAIFVLFALLLAAAIFLPKLRRTRQRQ